MSRARNFVVVAVVTAAAVGAAILSQQREDAIPSAGEPLFPGLLARVNDARAVSGVSGGEAFTIELADGTWVVREKDGYPADPDRVHLLLVGAAGLTRIEPKTSNPDLYPRIGLEDPSGPSAGSMRLVIKDGAGEALADFVAGARRPSKTTLEDSEIYVRLGDDPQSWLVQGKLPRPGGPVDWVRETIVGVPEARIHEVEVTHPDGEVVRMRKAMPGDVDYLMVDMPEGREIDGQWKLNDIGRSFSAFELADVRSGDLATVGGEQGVRAEMRTYDGLVVTLDTRVVEDRTYGVFGARHDPSLAADLDALRESAGDERQRSALEELRDASAVAAEAEELAARWSGWVFELPGYRASYFAKRLEEMLAQPEAESPPAPDAAPAAGGTPAS